jgi:hypothetical protein
MKLATALVALLLGAGTASAGVGVGFIAQATRYGDQPNRNLGATLELSLDRGAWQHFTELGVLAFSLGNEVIDGHAGTLWRGGLGTRFLAHRVRMPRMDLVQGFEVLATAQHLQFPSGTGTTRPELAAGWMWSFAHARIAFRTSVRVFMVPSPSRTVSCRGACPGHDVATSGFMVVTGLAW